MTAHRIAVIDGDGIGPEVIEVVPPDLGGKATTQQVTDAVIAAIRGANLSLC